MSTINRKSLDNLFKEIDMSFTAARCVEVTIRPFDLEILEEAGVTKASEFYQFQLKKIDALIENLRKFTATTQDELTLEQVQGILVVLKTRIDKAVNLDDPIKNKAWAKTIMREANLEHSARVSNLYIDQLAANLSIELAVTKKDVAPTPDIKIVATVAVKLAAPTPSLATNGLGGFIKPQKEVYVPPARRSSPPQVTISRGKRW